MSYSPRQLAKDSPQGLRQPGTWQCPRLQTALQALDTTAGTKSVPFSCVPGARENPAAVISHTGTVPRAGRAVGQEPPAWVFRTFWPDHLSSS